MKKYSMRSIPAAAAMAAVLIFGGQAHAQSMTPPPGSTNKEDAPLPEPKGGVPKRAAADPSNPSGNPVAKSATMTPGTTSSLDNVSPTPMGGKAKSAEDRTAARMAKDEKNPAKAAKRAKRKAPPDDVNVENPRGGGG